MPEIDRQERLDFDSRKLCLSQDRPLRARALEGLLRLVGGDTALGRGRWRMCSREPSGRRLEHVSRLTVILRPLEGAWKIVVALPWE